jgi:uncharacterized protein YbjT (DUF2867 family)
MIDTRSPILVTGATGAQGGATARALLARGCAVRALVRQPDAPPARALREAGAELVRGELDDAASLARGMQGAAGVFSVQVPDVKGNDSERRHGFALVQAARTAGVPHFVHTSVSGTAQRTQFPRWNSGYWSHKYWNDKWEIEEAVRQAGFSRWTVLRPAFMMDNFARPKSDFMFPHLRHGELATALHAATRLQLIAADDIGAFACAAFTAPADFGSQEIDLAGEALTMDEVADTLSGTLGKQVLSFPLSPVEALARGLRPGWVRSQEWINEVGYQAHIPGMARWGLPLTSFAAWARRHAAAIASN